MAIVYSLSHPDTNAIYYVGFTTKTANERLAGHIISADHPTTLLLRRDKRVPIVTIIEEGESVTEATETYWIKEYLKRGYKLENKNKAVNYQSEIARVHNPESITNAISSNDRLRAALTEILRELPIDPKIPLVRRIKHIAELALSL